MRNSKGIQIVVKLGLILPVFGAAFFPFLTSTADAQVKKITPTMTITSSSTPTLTSTDSLNVFETPNTPTVDPLAIYVSEPLEGNTISGIVDIKGKTDVLGFARQEIEFSYQANPADTWFLLSRSNQGVKNGSLAAWDTSTISDGDYMIRLRVFFSDGSWRDTLVKGIKVRN